MSIKSSESQLKQLFWSIFSAADEAALHDLVSNDPLLRDEGNWYPYGGRD
jgi:hypothetical protein